MNRRATPSDLYSEAMGRRIVAEFASRRNEVERVTLETSARGRAICTNGTHKPTDITPMGTTP